MDKKLSLVTFRQARRLCELGFDWEVNACYKFVRGESNCVKSEKNYDLITGLKDGVYSTVGDGMDGYQYGAPTVALALKWFRDVMKIACAVLFISPMFTSKLLMYYGGHKEDETTEYQEFDTYEQAEIELLDRLLN